MNKALVTNAQRYKTSLYTCVAVSVAYTSPSSH